MRRAVVLALVMGVFVSPAAAQDWAPWNNNYNYRPRGPVYAPPPPTRQPKGFQRAPAPWWAPFDDDDGPPARPAMPRGPGLLDGGPRPSIAPMPPQQVAFRNAYGSGAIVIDTAGRSLYLVTSSTTALRYPIAVGRIGFTWTGPERISRIATWPDWPPPPARRAGAARPSEKVAARGARPATTSARLTSSRAPIPPGATPSSGTTSAGIRRTTAITIRGTGEPTRRCGGFMLNRRICPCSCHIHMICP